MTAPLPDVSDFTAPFWTSGRSGQLTVRQCPRCAALAHPSIAVCAACGVSMAWTAVSGRGVIVAITRDHQQGAGQEAPPIFAVVALDEDPRVRLTSAIVASGPLQPEIGRPVEVRFVEREDVWLPFFTPVDDAVRDVAPLVPEPTRAVRPVASARKFEEHVALTGVGRSDVGRRLFRHPVELAVQATRAALADAGLQPADIDGLATYPGASLTASGMSEGGVTALEEALQLRPTWHNGAMETPGQAGALIAAMLAVAAGLCRHVLCVRTVWESTRTAIARTSGNQSAGASRVTGDSQWRAPFGATTPASWLALPASHYLHRYGATREAFGWVAINARANAGRHPGAVYREPMTMDDYLAARMISTPFGLLDCDVPCDGAVAIIVSARDASRDLASPAVLVDAVGTQITERQSWDQGTLTHEPNVFGPASHLWSRTSLTRGDVDVAELYDGFTFNCLSWLEALGFCGLGEAPQFVEGGHRIALDGSLPLNTHGGQLSGGRLHGFGFVEEAMHQLRGRAGARQVPGAEVAVVSTGGGTPGSCLLLTRDR